HRWTLHSDRVQPPDFDNSPVNHLTELQSVSPQQLTQPFRYSTEALPLHLDPPLIPLSMSPQYPPAPSPVHYYSEEEQRDVSPPLEVSEGEDEYESHRFSSLRRDT
ncbi:hypothetical protein NL108_003079, partial [Boleophthalmus pectinirostris]